MSLNSVITNVGAMIALQSLDTTNSALAAAQKQVSTGYRVADSTDDGAAYAIAQNVRSTVGALSSANQQLGNVQGLLSTTQSGLNNISNTMGSMRDVLLKLSDGNVQGSDRTNYQKQYESLLANLKSFIQDSTYNGKTLLDNTSSSGGATGGNCFGSVNVARNEAGQTYHITQSGMSAVFNSIANITSSFSTANGVSATAVALSAFLTSGGTFINQQNKVGQDLNQIGASINYVNNQVSYNTDKIDALNAGLGSLVDADLAQESANLQALQIRQQLGTQALTLANQAPQTILSLFK